MPAFRLVDDTLGVVYTHGIAGLAGGLLVGILADSKMASTSTRTARFSRTGSAHLFKMQLYTGLWVIVFTAIMTFILLKLVGLMIPLRMSEKDMEEGDLAVHGHEVYPSDIPSLGYPRGCRAGRRPCRRSRRRACSSRRPREGDGSWRTQGRGGRRPRLSST